MAYNSEHHPVPNNGQAGYWGQYRIPRALPGQVNMQAHPAVQQIPVLGSLQAHPAVQPMETAEQHVQHQGNLYQPIPTLVTAGRHQETGTDLSQRKLLEIFKTWQFANLKKWPVAKLPPLFFLGNAGIILAPFCYVSLITYRRRE